MMDDGMVVRLSTEEMHAICDAVYALEACVIIARDYSEHLNETFKVSGISASGGVLRAMAQSFPEHIRPVDGWATILPQYRPQTQGE